MAESMDLAAMLRVLRRRADLSQRELALRAGVPQATLARIESGRSLNPSFRTVERLVSAVGEALDLTPVSPIPHEQLRDRAGRHYPAHLDPRKVNSPEEWWGAWWTLTVARSHWPLEQVPEYTYDLSRWRRNRRRRRQRRSTAPGAPC